MREGRKMKQEIENALLANHAEEAWRAIQKYEKIRPRDFELFSYYVSYFLLVQDTASAWKYAKQAVNTNPFHIEANYNYAVCSELCKDLLGAYDYFVRTDHLQRKYELQVIDQAELDNRIQSLREDILRGGGQKELSYINARFQYMIKDPFMCLGNVIGRLIADSNGQNYYVGRYNSWYEAYYRPQDNRNANYAKCEIFPVDVYGRSYHIETQEPLLIPVALNPNLDGSKTGDDSVMNYLKDGTGSDLEIYTDPAVCKYSYIPVRGKRDFETAYPAVFARPISLKQDRKNAKKRIVFNIFLDSLNEKVVKEYGMEKLMPYTHNFFAKGLRCRQYYSGSEYTLPSIATYWTGKRASRHMNVDNHYRWDFMGEQKNLAEYFKEAGYVTAKIGGNDAVTPTQGYIRGIDMFLYQQDAEGMTVKEAVADAIEHMETFQETNQFIWMDIVDLHQIAGWFMPSINVQSKLPLETRFIDNRMISTVKQTRSRNREQIYIAQMQKIDLYLSLLYQYLTEHYQENEMVVTFFSDHGTAFLVDDDQPFISWQRTNIPLLVRAEGLKGEDCDEVIQTSDYPGILCKLAGIPYDYAGTDGNLPLCMGGKRERSYAFSECLFPGDPYSAGLHGKNFHVYYRTEKPVGKEFRIDVEGSRLWAVDDAGLDITDTIDEEEYRHIVEDAIAHLIK